jgi:cobalt-zinc-cadmium efflux system outer membrane protein
MLRADAAGALARLLTEQERLQAADSHIGQIERMIEVLRTREREGEGSRFDRLRSEQELREARQARTAAAVALAGAKATVSALLPRDTVLGNVTPAKAERAVPQPEALIAQARATRPELRALERSARRAELEADAARRARLPSPAVFGGLKRADDVSGREQGGVFGLSLSLPLFDGGGREAARWRAERARIDFERAALEDQIRAEINQASEVIALRQAALSEDQPGAGDELMRIAEVAYREGEVGIVELIDAVRTASRAGFRSIDIRLEVRLAQIALERAVGGILWP